MRRPGKRYLRLAGQVALATILVIVLFLNLAPLVWGLLASIRPREAIMAYPPRVFTEAMSLEHYRTIFEGGFLQPLQSSTIYALVTALGALLLGSLAAYAIDRLRFRGRYLVLLAVVSGIPLASGAAALIVPNYIYLTSLGLTNSVVTLPMIYIAYNLPLVTWILKGAIAGISPELDEAAAVDGANRFQTLFGVILPLCKPAIGAAAIFAFVGAWNEFVAGSVLVESTVLRPIQVAIYQNIGFFGRDWGPLLASAAVATLPIIVIFILFGRLLVSGLTAGSVKG